MPTKQRGDDDRTRVCISKVYGLNIRGFYTSVCPQTFKFNFGALNKEFQLVSGRNNHTCKDKIISAFLLSKS